MISERMPLGFINPENETSTKRWRKKAVSSRHETPTVPKQNRRPPSMGKIVLLLFFFPLVFVFFFSI